MCNPRCSWEWLRGRNIKCPLASIACCCPRFWLGSRYSLAAIAHNFLAKPEARAPDTAPSLPRARGPQAMAWDLRSFWANLSRNHHWQRHEMSLPLSFYFCSPSRIRLKRVLHDSASWSYFATTCLIFQWLVTGYKIQSRSPVAVPTKIRLKRPKIRKLERSAKWAHLPQGNRERYLKTCFG